MGMTLTRADELVRSATTYADGHGYLISCAIVDDAGHLMALARMDGAKWMSPDIARAKAVASAAFRQNTAKLEAGAGAKTLFYVGVSLVQPGSIAIGQGALPIWIGDRLGGAIGISGLAPERDEEVAIAALVACGYPIEASELGSLAAQGFSRVPVAEPSAR